MSVLPAQYKPSVWPASLETARPEPLPRYEQLSGRDLFQARSLTGLNRIPVVLLTSFITRGARVTGETPAPVETLVQHLLVDGPIFEVAGDIQTDVIYSAPNEVHQLIADVQVDGRANDVIRIWRRVGDNWELSDYRADNNAIISGPIPVPGANVRYFYNPTEPQGILFDGQDVYHRLEEIARVIRKYQTGPGAKTLLMGFVRNLEEAKRELNGPDPTAVIPGEVQVDRVGSTAAVDQMLREAEHLQPLWYQLTHVVDTASPVQRPSGVDRELAMAPMMRFIEHVRAQMDSVLALWGATWTYERLQTMSVMDRAAEYDLLSRALADGVIDNSEFIERAQRII